MMRDHTLITILAERMHELASYIDRGGMVPEASVEECLAVHDQLLVRSHHTKEAFLDAELARLKNRDLSSALASCGVEHPKARQFQTRSRKLLTGWKRDPTGTANAAARLIHEEADRIVAHHRSEEERLYVGLETLLPATTQKKVLAEFGRLSPQAAVAETRLQSWASRFHPSSD